MLAVQGSAILQGRNRSDGSRHSCDDRAYFVQNCCPIHFARFTNLSLAILIARTFFIIRRSVALSAADNVILAIQLRISQL
jgi:hypothetical protein